MLMEFIHVSTLWQHVKHGDVEGDQFMMCHADMEQKRLGAVGDSSTAGVC